MRFKVPYAIVNRLRTYLYFANYRNAYSSFKYIYSRSYIYHCYQTYRIIILDSPSPTPNSYSNNISTHSYKKPHTTTKQVSPTPVPAVQKEARESRAPPSVVPGTLLTHADNRKPYRFTHPTNVALPALCVRTYGAV